MEPLAQIADHVADICKDIGTYQLQHFRTDAIQRESKNTANDLVTQVDRESERRIIDALSKIFPDCGFICEESGSEGEQKDWVWIVDPLDGTVNFANGLPVFAISIALKNQVKDEIAVGVVYAPYLNELYRATLGGGAFRNNSQLAFPKNRNRTPLEFVLSTGFPYDKHQNPQNNFAEVSRIGQQIGGVRRLGAAAYDLCCVAAGFVDGYWEQDLKIWDVAAGILIAQEAGRYVSELPDKRPMAIVAGSADAHGFILDNL